VIASSHYARATTYFARIVKVMPIFVETYRATVAPADCDHLGHMNVQHYFAAVSDGMFGIMVRLGLGPEEIRRRQMAFAVVHAETDFHHELHAGDVVALGSTVLKPGEKSAIFGHRLKNVATGNIAMSTEFKCVLLDLEKTGVHFDPGRHSAAAAQLIASHGDA
jgi:acyl-CoA thioester hydrolase